MTSLASLFLRRLSSQTKRRIGRLRQKSSINTVEPFHRNETLPEISPQENRVTHLYKGKKVVTFDPQRSKSHIDRLILIRSCSATRRRENKILLEGSKLIRDAIVNAKVEPIAFYSWKAENFTEVPAAAIAPNVQFYVLPKRDFLRLSLVETPQPVIALCRRPELVEECKDAMPLYLICDGVRDPGNLGTLIRSAAAVGCRRLITMKGTCDPWDPKVVRASAGANFLIPMSTYVSWKDVNVILPSSTAFLFADCSQSDMEYDQVQWTCDVGKGVDDHVTGLSEDETTQGTPHDVSMALVVSNEGWGLTQAAENFFEERKAVVSVRVPMSEKVNSLNCSIAASIIMWELRKKYLKTTIEYPF